MKKLFKTSVIVLLVILSVWSFPLAANAETLDVGIPVEEYPDLFHTRTLPTHGEGRVLVFLIQFPDMMNDNPDATAEHYNELYFKEEAFVRNPSSSLDYSVSGFYERESNGKLKLTGEVFGWYTAKHERAYYDYKKLELIEEAAQYYIGKGEDLSRFDADNDGVIDALVFHFSGEADDDNKEPWYRGRETECNLTHSIAGKKIGTYIQVYSDVDMRKHSLDMRRTIWHELMHSLGLFDLYGSVWLILDATDDLMNHNDDDINPYYKMLLGWTEKVNVITSSVDDIRLNEWIKTGETLLVTDSFNGIFDEFYMVTYDETFISPDKDGTKPTQNPNKIRIWRIDARTNEAKTKFLYDNFRYTPKPEMGDPHGTGKVSKYLFIEELSAIPLYDRVLNLSTSDLFFCEGRTFGPNTVPNSDTHDGRYTGIRIDDFKRNDGYATMDITFEKKDTTPPRISEELSLIGATGESKLRFDQNIYVSDNWSQIKVTDLNGARLNAEIKKSHYPAHEIEVKITSAVPKDGYKIIIPAGCVCDSSGNKNEAGELVFDHSEYVFVESKEFIPWYYENKERRWEFAPLCFTYGDESIVIARTGEGDTRGKFIEFIKTDAKGNITAHKFIINPESDSTNIQACQTKDGGYLITAGGSTSFLICIDRNGEVRWQKKVDFMMNTPVLLGDRVEYYYCQIGTGFKTAFKFVSVDLATGDMTVRDRPADIEISNPCYNGKTLVSFGFKYRMNVITISEIDPVTLQQTRETIEIELPGIKEGLIMDAAYNSNGSYTVIMRVEEASTGVSNTMVIAFDPSFNIMKTLKLKGMPYGVFTYPDDGFVIVEDAVEGEHNNDLYHVIRVDKNLNLMWESDIETAHLGVFVTSGNEICAFASDFKPKRYAYLLRLGSEDKYEVESHMLSHREAFDPTCQKEGEIEHWLCLDCKKVFSDAEGTKEIAPNSVYLPKKDHVIVPCDEVKPTCTEGGYTGGTWCKYCKLTVINRTPLDPCGHEPQPYEEVKPTCTSKGYTGGTYCKNCNVELEKRSTLPKRHNLVPYETVEPTCTETGFKGGRYCDVCGWESSPRSVTKAKGHREYPNKTVEPTCTEDGSKGGTHCSVCGVDIQPKTVIKAKGHTETASKDVPPTCIADGSKGGTHCKKCGEQITPPTVIKATGHTALRHTDRAATCTEDGYIGAAFCKTCGEVLEEQTAVKALGHTPTPDPAVKPTRWKEGLTEGSHCSVCGATLVAQETAEMLKPTGVTLVLIIAIPCAVSAVIAAVVTVIKRKKRTEA